MYRYSINYKCFVHHTVYGFCHFSCFHWYFRLPVNILYDIAQPDAFVNDTRLQYIIDGHKPPGHNPPPGQNPCRIRTQCTMSFYVTGKGVLIAKFQDWRT